MKMFFKAQYGCALGRENMVPLSKVQQHSIAVRYILTQISAPTSRRSSGVEFKFLFCFMVAVLLLVRLHMLTTFPLAK